MNDYMYVWILERVASLVDYPLGRTHIEILYTPNSQTPNSQKKKIIEGKKITSVI